MRPTWRSDPENRYLWRFRPQRLDAEIVRDTMLAVGGNINLDGRRPADLSVHRRRRSWPASIAASGQHAGRPAAWRRSVYVYQRRSLPFPMFETFDHPDMNVTAGARNVSTVPTQALTLLNNPFVLPQAELLRRPGRSEATRDPRSRRSIWRIGSRSRGPPTQDEIAVGADLIRSAVAGRLHARAAEPERVPVHEVRPCRIDAQSISGPGASSSSDPAAASAAWRWRICSTSRGCLAADGRRRRRLRGRRGRRQPVRAEAAALHAAREGRDLAVHERRLSQVDTFDPKPALTKYAGQPIDGKVQGRRHRAAGLSRAR